MATFRNIETGNQFSIGERWASKLRTQPHLVELDASGSELPSEPSPVAESDPALKSVRIADLRAMAEEQGLSTDGSKAELVARLSAAEAAE